MLEGEKKAVVKVKIIIIKTCSDGEWHENNKT